VFLVLTLILAADARVSIDPFTETAYFAQEPAAVLSSNLTIRQRNDGTGFALQAVGPCRGMVDFEKTNVTCKPGVSEAYTSFMRDGIAKLAADLTPAQKDLRDADVLVGSGKLVQARKAYQMLVKRGLAKVVRLAEISAAEMCWRVSDRCDALDDFKAEGVEERERLAILRLTQSRPLDALALADRLRSLRGMIVREHALAMAVRETFLGGDDLALLTLYFRFEQSINDHGDARELRLLVLHAFYELEANDALRAFVKPGDRTLGMVRAVAPIEKEGHQ